MLLTVTPSLKEEEAEKMRPLRYHTTRGGGLPAKNTNKNTEKYSVQNISVVGLIAIYYFPFANHHFCV